MAVYKHGAERFALLFFLSILLSSPLFGQSPDEKQSGPILIPEVKHDLSPPLSEMLEKAGPLMIENEPPEAIRILPKALHAKKTPDTAPFDLDTAVQNYMPLPALPGPLLTF